MNADHIAESAPEELAGVLINPKILQFDGPPNFHCFGNHYVEVRSVADTREQVVADFQTHLDAVLEDAEQLAWRCRPQILCSKGRWLARARLAVCRYDR